MSDASIVSGDGHCPQERTTSEKSGFAHFWIGSRNAPIISRTIQNGRNPSRTRLGRDGTTLCCTPRLWVQENGSEDRMSTVLGALFRN